MSIPIALVEDNPDLRRRFTERFRYFDEVRLVLTAGSGEAFLEQIQEAQELPKVVLMDIELPGISSIDTTALLKDRFPEIEVMMLTVFEDETRIFAAVRSGASGYLLKDASTDQILASISEVLNGGGPMSPVVARKMVQFVRGGGKEAGQTEEPQGRFQLSEREMNILECLVRDDTEAAIADSLFISPHTVRTHVKNIYKKLHVHSRAAAVRLALEHRLLRK